MTEEQHEPDAQQKSAYHHEPPRLPVFEHSSTHDAHDVMRDLQQQLLDKESEESKHEFDLMSEQKQRSQSVCEPQPDKLL